MKAIMHAGQVISFGPLGTDDMIVAFSMHGSKNRIGHITNMFHDVDLP